MIDEQMFSLSELLKNDENGVDFENFNRITINKAEEVLLEQIENGEDFLTQEALAQGLLKIALDIDEEFQFIDTQDLDRDRSGVRVYSIGTSLLPHGIPSRHKDISAVKQMFPNKKLILFDERKQLLPFRSAPYAYEDTTNKILLPPQIAILTSSGERSCDVDKLLKRYAIKIGNMMRDKNYTNKKIDKDDLDDLVSLSIDETNLPPNIPNGFVRIERRIDGVMHMFDICSDDYVKPLLIVSLKLLKQLGPNLMGSFFIENVRTNFRQLTEELDNYVFDMGYVSNVVTADGSRKLIGLPMARDLITRIDTKPIDQLLVLLRSENLSHEAIVALARRFGIYLDEEAK